MGAYFYPATAECQAILVAPFPPAGGGSPFPPLAPNNTMGGYGGFLDVNDYNGSVLGKPNIFVPPDPVPATGLQDFMDVFYSPNSPPSSWYLVRQTDFKDWGGVGGIFWKTTDFVMEIDILPAMMPASGGFRDEAANLAVATAVGGSPNFHTPYPGGLQGSGICLRAVITDPITHLEVVKDTKFFQGVAGVDFVLNPISFPRQIVSLNLAGVTVDEMSTMVLRVMTQQYSGSFDIPFPQRPHSALDSTIYRIGLKPDPASLKSSGKQSAAMTSR
jgi:hypothetical protein